MSLSANIDVLHYLEPQSYLAAIYADLKNGPGRWTYNSFSHALGFGENNYSHLIIAGHRKISSKAATKIIKALKLSGDRRQYFEALCLHQYGQTGERDTALAQILTIRSRYFDSDLDRHAVEYLSEWYHPVILELVGRQDFDPAPAWIAARIHPSITEDQADHGFKLLQRLGYVEYDARTAQWLKTTKNVVTPRQVRSLAVKRYHQQMIGLARDALFDVPAGERDISALTITLTSEQFETCKQALRDTRRSIMDDCQTEGTADGRIYQLNVQLFPLTTGDDQ